MRRSVGAAGAPRLGALALRLAALLLVCDATHAAEPPFAAPEPLDDPGTPASPDEPGAPSSEDDAPAPAGGDPVDAPSAPPGDDSNASARGASEAVGTFALTWLWAEGKAMPGIELGGSWGMLQVALEGGLVFLTDESPELDGSFVGGEVGVHAGGLLRLAELELGATLGLDLYPLWGIHSSVFELALAARVNARYWLGESFGLGVGARGYLVSSSGLELGTTRSGESGSPILLSTALTWRFR